MKYCRRLSAMLKNDRKKYTKLELILKFEVMPKFKRALV